MQFSVSFFYKPWSLNYSLELLEDFLWNWKNIRSSDMKFLLLSEKALIKLIKGTISPPSSIFCLTFPSTRIFSNLPTAKDKINAVCAEVRLEVIVRNLKNVGTTGRVGLLCLYE